MRTDHDVVIASVNKYIGGTLKHFVHILVVTSGKVRSSFFGEHETSVLRLLNTENH